MIAIMGKRRTPLPKVDPNFYRMFEDRFRGPMEEIYNRLKFYVPLIMPLKTIYQECRALDLGCGRGEWLQLLHDIGFVPYGVDHDANMLAACREKGLSYEQADAIQYLKGLHDESMTIVSGFHLVEHLPFDEVHALVKEAHRVLKPAGILILETPNPENLFVATNSFYLDPTHQKPIPPALLKYLPEYYGFHRVQVVRLQQSETLKQKEQVSLLDVFGGVSPDYAVIAQKEAKDEILALFNDFFKKEYGITINDLAKRHELSYRKISELERQLAAERGKVQTLEQVLQESTRRADESKEREEKLKKDFLKVTEALNEEREKREKIQKDAQENAKRSEFLFLELARIKEQAKKLENEFKNAQQLREETQKRLGVVEQDLAAERGKAAALEQVLQESTRRAEVLQGEVERARAEVERERQTKEEAYGLVKSLEQELAAERGKAAALEQVLQESTRRVEELEGDNTNLHAELHNVHQSNHYHYTLAESRAREIEALRNSYSWKITYPLRIVWSGILTVRRLPCRMINEILRRSIDRFQRPLSRLMKIVLQYPKLSTKINAFLIKYPPLYGQLLSVAHRQNVLNVFPTQHQELFPQQTQHSNVDLTILSPRARKIYCDLQKAIKKRTIKHKPLK
ncbi:MAG: methyltransferase domain-containing protein [Clostridia bacterium]|nr:methyltransferase domain-containing protein [Clostridia bacterium]